MDLQSGLDKAIAVVAAVAALLAALGGVLGWLFRGNFWARRDEWWRLESCGPGSQGVQRRLQEVAHALNLAQKNMGASASANASALALASASWPADNATVAELVGNVKALKSLFWWWRWWPVCWYTPVPTAKLTTRMQRCRASLLAVQSLSPPLPALQPLGTVLGALRTALEDALPRDPEAPAAPGSMAQVTNGPVVKVWLDEAAAFVVTALPILKLHANGTAVLVNAPAVASGSILLTVDNLVKFPWTGTAPRTHGAKSVSALQDLLRDLRATHLLDKGWCTLQWGRSAVLLQNGKVAATLGGGDGVTLPPLEAPVPAEEVAKYLPAPAVDLEAPTIAGPVCLTLPSSLAAATTSSPATSALAGWALDLNVKGGQGLLKLQGAALQLSVRQGGYRTTLQVSGPPDGAGDTITAALPHSSFEERPPKPDDALKRPTYARPGLVLLQLLLGDVMSPPVGCLVVPSRGLAREVELLVEAAVAARPVRERTPEARNAVVCTLGVLLGKAQPDQFVDLFPDMADVSYLVPAARWFAGKAVQEGWGELAACLQALPWLLDWPPAPEKPDTDPLPPTWRVDPKPAPVLGFPVAALKHDFLSALADKAFPSVKRILTVIGPLLPDPGPTVAKELCTLLVDVSRAPANKDNLMRLADFCAGLMGVITAKLEPAAGNKLQVPNDAFRTAYSSTLGRFGDVLQDVRGYAQVYTAGQPYLDNLLESKADARRYNSISAKLAPLGKEALGMTVVGVPVDIQPAVNQIKDTLDTPVLTYTDHSAELQAFAMRMGDDMRAVVASPELSELAVAELKLGQQLTVRINEQLIRNALSETGVHLNIKQPELRSLWYKYFTGLEEVSWQLFWIAFPSGMNEFLPVIDYQQLVDMLASNEAKVAFQAGVAGVDGGKEKNISVAVIAKNFKEGPPLVQQVQQIFTRLHERSNEARAKILKLWSQGLRLWTEARAWRTVHPFQRNENAHERAETLHSKATALWITFEAHGLLAAWEQALVDLAYFKEEQGKFMAMSEAERESHNNNYAKRVVDEAVTHYQECVVALDRLRLVDHPLGAGGAGPSARPH